jgi:glycosyltransferase involved in cell wall biosynthesis
MTEKPSVEVLIPTHNRPELVRAAIASVLSQHYAGSLGIAVVFDREEPDGSLVAEGRIPIRVLSNDRTPGLAGARNSGIVSSQADLVAFLDDDDRWLPGKLQRQVDFLLGRPQADFASTSIRVEFDGSEIERRAGVAEVTHERLLESRMSMLHSSTFLIKRDALLGPIGLVDETSPSSQREDWELLLRASRLHPIAHLDEPLVAVRWGATSLFAQAWQSHIASAEWILDRHPDVRTSPVGYARLLAQIAFAQAALGHRRTALRLAGQAARVRWREPRAYLAALAAAGVPPTVILKTLHRRGRGI